MPCSAAIANLDLPPRILIHNKASPNGPRYGLWRHDSDETDRDTAEQIIGKLNDADATGG